MRTWTRRARRGARAPPDPPAEARALLGRYREAFSGGYREDFAAPPALSDIAVIETLTAGAPAGRRASTATPMRRPTNAGLKVLSRSRPIPLSERVPVLENMGFRVVDERTYHIAAGMPHGPMSGCTT